MFVNYLFIVKNPNIVLDERGILSKKPKDIMAELSTDWSDEEIDYIGQVH